jgi:hypothetical protein
MLQKALNGELCAVPQFERYVGIDYSGAEKPISSLKSSSIAG